MQILSIKELKYKIKNNEVGVDIYVIMSTSTTENLKGIHKKLLLYYNDNYNDFTIKHAKQIKKFIKKVKDFNDLYIICDYGISRSAGICAALNKALYNNDFKIWNDPHYTPNAYIYKTLLKAFKIEITENELQEKIDINKKALKKAIKGDEKNG